MARENDNNNAETPFRVRSRFFSPPNEFAGCFTTFYHLQLDVDDGEISEFLLPEWGTIRFFAGSLPSGTIGASEVRRARFTGTGPSSLPLRFSTGSVRMWGIGFLPLGWSRFMACRAADLANTVCDGEVHPAFAPFKRLCEPLCDPQASDEQQLAAIAEVMSGLMRPNRDEARIVRVHAVLLDTALASVAELADRAGMSVRTLERITRRYFGFPPKLLIRRQRFMRSLTQFALNPAANWTEAMDSLYHDQAQFTREFTAFMGMTPSQYARLDHPILDSFIEARARLWGSPAQTLDPPA